MEENEILEARGLPRPVRIILGVLVGLFLVWLLIVLGSFQGESAEERAAKQRETEMLKELEPSGFDDHGPLRFATYIAAKASPIMVDLAEVEESMLDLPVVGITANETSHAYILRRGSEGKRMMLITTNVGAIPIVVLHNYEQDKTFVFTRKNKENYETIELGFGGYDSSDHIALMIGDSRFQQDSPKIPLDTYPFEIMSLREWSKLHASTLVNIDETLSHKDYFEGFDR